MEKLSDNPPVYFDGAHNISGAKMLYENISSIFAEKDLILVLGVLKEKGVGMFESLIRRAKLVINVTPDSYRSMPALQAHEETVMYNSNSVAFEDIPQALIYAEKQAKNLKDPLIIATGSLYLASDIKNYYSRTI